MKLGLIIHVYIHSDSQCLFLQRFIVTSRKLKKDLKACEAKHYYGRLPALRKKIDYFGDAVIHVRHYALHVRYQSRKRGMCQGERLLLCWYMTVQQASEEVCPSDIIIKSADNDSKLYQYNKTT